MDEILDMTVVEELLALSDDGDPELLLDLIEMFLDDGPVKVRAISEGLQAGDFDKMERAAHSLKGSSGNLGARRLQAACDRLQLTTRAHQLEETRRLAGGLGGLFAEAEAALRKVQRTYKS